MAIEGISGAINSNKVYAEVMKQNVSKEIKISQPQPQAQPKVFL